MVSILMGVFVSGMAYLFLNVVYSQPVSVSDIFFGFAQQPEKAVRIQAVMAAAQLPMLITLRVAQLSPAAAVSALCGVIALVFLGLYIWVRLTYSQAFFLLHDFPERTAGELLSMSRHLMEGRRRRLILLYLSFIPLYLLGIAALLIPLLWVWVYSMSSEAVFYRSLIEAEQAAGQAADQSGS